MSSTPTWRVFSVSPGRLMFADDDRLRATDAGAPPASDPRALSGISQMSPSSDFEPDLVGATRRPTVVVSMAGYSTVCELLSWRRRAVLVPRAAPVREQPHPRPPFRRARLIRHRGAGRARAQSPDRKVLAALGREPTPTLAVDLNAFHGSSSACSNAGGDERSQGTGDARTIVVVTSGFPRRSETFS